MNVTDWNLLPRGSFIDNNYKVKTIKHLIFIMTHRYNLMCKFTNLLIWFNKGPELQEQDGFIFFSYQ